MTDVRWPWLISICLFLIAAIWVMWPDYEAPFTYEATHLRPAFARSGESVDLCVKGVWTEVPISGQTKVSTMCGDGKPLAIEFYPLDLSGPKSGAMVVDKCGVGGKPRPFEVRCKATGDFFVTTEQTFRRRTWWGWRYETTHPAYTIRGTVLP